MTRLAAWWSERVPITGDQLRELTNEPVPNHMKKWWFALGGTPAYLFVVQIITGLMLAYRMLPDISLWFDMSIPIAHGIMVKLILLGLTFIFALDARLRVIPKLSESNLNDMALHIIPVTLFSILFVIAGVSFRAGWLL